MQDQQRTIGSLPGIASLLQRPSSSGTDMNQQTSLSHMQNAVGAQLSDHIRSSGETVSSCATGLDVQSFSGWNSGGPSCGLNLHNQVDADDLKTDHGRSSSCSARPEDGDGPEERQYEPNNVTFPVSSSANLCGNQSRIEPFFLQGSSSNHGTQNVGINMECVTDTANRGKSTAAGSGLNFLNSCGLDREKASFGTSFRDRIGSSSGSSSYMDGEENTSSRSSLVDWGSSCKRKAFEGSSRQLCTGGSSSTSVEPESGRWHTGPADLNASSNLGVSASLGYNPVANPPIQQIAENEVREVASDAFSSLNVLENVERPVRNLDRRIAHSYCQESVPLNLSSTGSARRSSHPSLHRIPSSNPFNDSLELRLTAGVTAASSSASQSQSHAVHIPGLSGNMHSVTWDGAANPRGTNISTSFVSGERAVREDLNLGIFPRDSTESPMPVPLSPGQDHASWHMSSGSSEGVPPSWIGSSSSVHSLPNPSWIVHHEVSPQNQQRLPEFSPWSFFPSVSLVSGFHNGQSSSSSSGPPTFTEETSNHQTYPRSTSLMERRVDNVFTAPHSLRALAVDIEGRRRLISEIRQVLNAMRRGENLRAEDYMFFDPFVYHGMAEMHDRHRDMRLDVDNMSYEELLALEERIGDVSTGLSEDMIMKLMKQRVFTSAMTQSSTDLEPCCICQEEYADGDDIGSLDCAHEFHINCIKQWLQLKNLCPICKTAGLTT